MRITYDGEYPNLCSGNLSIEIDGKTWEFPPYSLQSGGSVWFDKYWQEHIEEGDWVVVDWPEGFPIELKEEVVKKINEEISHGCCGGCV